MGATEKLMTLGEIAKLAGVPVHRATFLARRYEPIARAGRFRVYSAGDVESMVAELRGGEAPSSRRSHEERAGVAS